MPEQQNLDGVSTDGGTECVCSGLPMKSWIFIFFYLFGFPTLSPSHTVAHRKISINDLNCRYCFDILSNNDVLSGAEAQNGKWREIHGRRCSYDSRRIPSRTAMLVLFGDWCEKHFKRKGRFSAAIAVNGKRVYFFNLGSIEWFDFFHLYHVNVWIFQKKVSTYQHMSSWIYDRKWHAETDASSQKSIYKIRVENRNANATQPITQSPNPMHSKINLNAIRM